MSFGPQVVMPGAFHFEAPNGSALSGVHPGMFRPPISPSASSSMYLGKSTGSLYSDASTPAQNVKRKRRGYGESRATNGWPTTTSDAGLSSDDVGTNRFHGEGERRYILAGQMGTPNGVAPNEIKEAMEDSVYSDIDYRRALASKPSHIEHNGIELSNFNYAAASPTFPTQTQQHNRWGSVALSKIGGVVGKVFQFCTAGVFRGFYAGGGKGYEMRAPTRQQSTSNEQAWCNEHDIPTLPALGPSATPGGFPQSDYSPSQRGFSPESTPPPAAKRRQINDGFPSDELRRNWVLVQDSPEKTRPQSRASEAPMSRTPQQVFPPVLHRRINRPVSRVNTPSYARRQSSRISHAGAASLTNREPASFASPRAQSPVPPYTPSRIPVSTRPQSPSLSPTRLSQQPSFIPSPSIHPKRSHRRNHSTASAASRASSRVRRRESAQGLEDNSPRLDAEAKNLAAKRIQEEMETDLRMNDLNARLRDMIRQGKEALGTKIEVELDDAGGLDPWESE
ncbi:hypothetical protein F5Y06DRAFT_218890 [Hypoxylon sp. FL0890]|nr:hypothetical protein F5Y06DRAFT_218890 [Hypoxylon sp. FL0890]